MTTQQKFTAGQKVTIGIFAFALVAFIGAMIFLLVTPAERSTSNPTPERQHEVVPSELSTTGVSASRASRSLAVPLAEQADRLPAESFNIAPAPVLAEPIKPEAPAPVEEDARIVALRTAGIQEDELADAVHLIFDVKASNPWSWYFNAPSPDIDGAATYFRNMRAHVQLKYGNWHNALLIAQTNGAW